MFGKIFKDLRDNKQLTLIELSEKTGVSKSYLHDIENEKIAPSDKIIEKCSHIAQVEGRMERIDCGQPYNVIVDFAHTPDGMEKMIP